MLNYPTQDREDKKLLRDTYEALQNQELVEIITDKPEIEHIFKQIVNSLSLPTESVFTIANFFKFKTHNRVCYIAQCLQDFRFTVNKRGLINDKYDYHLVGFAELSEDFGKIILRPETRSDRIVGKFFKSDIQITDSEDFNNRYYLAATDSEKATNFFTPEIVKVIAKSREVHLKIDNAKLFIFLENEMTPTQIVMIEKILFETCFLKK